MILCRDLDVVAQIRINSRKLARYKACREDAAISEPIDRICTVLLLGFQGLILLSDSLKTCLNTLLSKFTE